MWLSRAAKRCRVSPATFTDLIGVGRREPEDSADSGSVLIPCQRKIGIEQPGGRQPGWLGSVDDGLQDLRREPADARHPGEPLAAPTMGLRDLLQGLIGRGNQVASVMQLEAASLIPGTEGTPGSPVPTRPAGLEAARSVPAKFADQSKRAVSRRCRWGEPAVDQFGEIPAGRAPAGRAVGPSLGAFVRGRRGMTGNDERGCKRSENVV